MRASEAARLAAQLAPWRSSALSLHAERLAVRQGLAAARAPMRAALALAPADPVIWHRSARMLARHGDFGPALLAARERTLALAPQSRALQLAGAIEGAYYWRHGSPELRAFWLERMRFTLRNETALRFLRSIAWGEREAFVCAYAGKALRLERWCERAARVRVDCQSPRANEGQKQWCRQNGFLRGTTP